MKHRRSSLMSEKLTRQKRKRRFIFFGMVVAFLILVGSIIFFLFRAPFFQIRDIYVEGNEVVDAESIKQLTNDILSANYFIFIPKRNKLIYPKKDIESEIRSKVGRIETISLDIKDQILNIKIGERGSYALWCKDEAKCFFIDKNGFIFSQSPTFSTGVYKIFTGVISDEEPVGKQFLDADKLSDIKILTDFLSENSWNTEKIEVKTVRDVSLVQQKGPKIKVDLTKPISNTLKTLKTLLSSSEFKKSTKNIANVDYIDARFGSKIFFKPKSDQLPASAIIPSI